MPLPKMENQKIKFIVLFTILIFLLAPIAIIIYIIVNNQKKRKFFEEKNQMKQAYETEIIKTKSEVREETLQTVGGDLHDNIGQLLSLTSLTLHSIDMEERERTQVKIDTAQAIIAQAIKEMRILGQLIQGDQLVNLGLVKAIQDLCHWIEKTGRFQIQFLIQGEIPNENNHSKDLFLFRISQEILNNIIRHSQAKEIKIKLAYENSLLNLEIMDDGIGFNVEEQLYDLPGMGLKNIDKRVEIMGGKLNIVSHLGKGVIINIFITYP
jgi:signal transduction histidine kinase